ncbi:c-type cytochrome [Gluconacetobacter sp. 1b LMG 1731]|uniref:C-type cytochrome n=1 Tax=Gluconacetobacter dulcium TaxID=2729096 RepID=A0A7W4K1U2_9PROT|nr:cytochrome-c peroxidase [Gluconacetobacter dulcium]MBB2165744.1 c-type cytochrome [Gluconacetobacter dulcium]MBB2194831.1 c-type cytochrome [Gluconacetobacter dulcium]MBB2198632.1 c-type cytochrome [Gluconacetobacter dulcium]
MSVRKAIVSVAVLGIVAYGGVVGYLTHFDHETAPTLDTHSPTLADPVTSAAFAAIREARCDYCHARNVELPFYFHVPVANQLMQRDVDRGLRHFRIEPVIEAFQTGAVPSEEQLARIEEVIRQNRMPPTLYLLMHWHAHLSQAQRDALLNWVAAERRAHYATPGVAARFAGEPVQPVPESVPVDAAKVALGQRLFFDKQLSGDGTLNCASCHALDHGGVDGRVTALGIGGQHGPINVPTVYDSVFNKSQFWNGRAATLAEQAAGPVMNPLEMGSHDWAIVADKVKQDPTYVSAFHDAFGSDDIDKGRITDAIAEYEKTLITPDSRFDRYLKGDEQALNAQEKNGYALFKSIGCSGCHTGVSLGGQAFEVMGLEGDYFAARGGAVTDADKGRFTVTQSPDDMERFKVPNLRNIALTAPYFHDGSVKTLEEAVRLMARYQTPDHTLSDHDIADIVAFLRTLTGTYQGQPLAGTQAP